MDTSNYGKKEGRRKGGKERGEERQRGGRKERVKKKPEL